MLPATRQRCITPAETGTQLSDPEEMQGCVHLVGWLYTVYRDGTPARPETVTHPSTNRARRALTSFMRRTPPTTMPLYATPPTIIIVVRPTIRPHRRSSWMRHIAAGEVALSVCLSVVHNREPYRTDEPIATLSGLCTRGVLTPKLANHVL